MISVKTRYGRRNTKTRGNLIRKAKGSRRPSRLQTELLEARIVLAHGVFFDFDGLPDPGTVDGGVAEFTGMDWLPGATYAEGSNQAVTNFLLNDADGGDRDISFQGFFE